MQLGFVFVSCFFVFSNFFVNMIYFTKFCWNFDKHPFGMRFFFLFFLPILCSLSILRFSFLSAGFLNNSNKKRNVALYSIKLGEEALSVWGKDKKEVNLGKNQQTEIYLLLYVHIYFRLVHILDVLVPQSCFSLNVLFSSSCNAASKQGVGIH